MCLLRSGILLLFIFINMSAVNYEYLCRGAAELTVSAPLITWIAKKSYQALGSSSNQVCENQQELLKMGAKIKYKHEALDNRIIAIPYRVKYPENCSQENKQKIDKIFDDLKVKVAYAPSFVDGVGQCLLVAAAFAVGLQGAINMLEGLIDIQGCC